MKDFLEDWGIWIVILLIGVPLYLYFNNPGFSSDVNKSLESPPYLSIRNDTLFIDDFEFSVRNAGSKQIEGDFEPLNKKVYDLLKGRSGDYQIILRTKKEDKYGNQTSQYKSFGRLSGEELNKYLSEDYWLKNGGIEKLIIADEPDTDISQFEKPIEASLLPQNATSNVTNSERKSNEIYRSYKGKYTFDEKGRIFEDDFTLDIEDGKVIYTKNGNSKLFIAVDKGEVIDEPQEGVKFSYHHFYLPNQKQDIFISYTKQIKHNGVFYYRLVIDGQSQLAL